MITDTLHIAASHPKRRRRRRTRKKATNILQLNQANRDPSRTTRLRAQFASAVTARLRKIKKDITTSIVDNDVFGLDIEMGKIPSINVPLPTRAFQFKTDGEKTQLFMDWLRGQNNRGILSLAEDAVRGTTGNVPWANTFIDSAYKRGIRRGLSELKKQGIVKADFTPRELTIDARFAQPIHAEKVAQIYLRVYRDLKGITDDMEILIRDRLAQGLAEGRSPRQIAQILNKTIDASGASLELESEVTRELPRGIKGRVIPETITFKRKLSSINRARIIARTEIIRAHHVATIATYREAGIVGVQVRAEWLTAGDDRVCAACAELEGQIFPLDVIEDMIPLHPQCRCAAIPVVQNFGDAKPISRSIIQNMSSWTPGMTVWEFKHPENNRRGATAGRFQRRKRGTQVNARFRLPKLLEKHLETKTKELDHAIT